MFRLVPAATAVFLLASSIHAEGLTTWDGKHSIEKIEVTVAYFVPRDRTPLPDWRERVDYFCRRIRQFHEREFQGQSTLTTRVLDEPFRSARTTGQLRSGDANFIFFQTLQEVDADLKFGDRERTAFPILLVLSDVNWRPLDDFWRLHPAAGKLEFEGNLSDGRHFPGAASGGARATYLADRGAGWGLVSADGWRVPYSGSDCVVYHEGLGHTVGLPHPEPANDTVMSMAQYRGWLGESSVDLEQKKKLGWKPPEKAFDCGRDLFSRFRALPQPTVPAPGEAVSLKLEWPAFARVKSVRVRIQTELLGPWLDVSPREVSGLAEAVPLGKFDRPTPVSYRVDAELEDGQKTELWGYFQVRANPETAPVPPRSPFEGDAPGNEPQAVQGEERDEIDLLALIDPARHKVSGDWTVRDGRLESPKEYGARIEIPYEPPEEYRLTVIAEPLDEPNALNLGQRSGDKRFLVLVNYAAGPVPASALENIDGRNVGNPTTLQGALLKRGQLSQIVCTVRRESVAVSVDGREIIHWKGDRSRLSLGDYWKTPRENALFLGAYDCRYRIYRATLRPLSGEGKKLE